MQTVGRRPAAFVHPSIDEFGQGYAVYATAVATVRLTAPFQLFLSDAVAGGLRPVLMTGMGAQVSEFVSFAMRAAGGVWAVQRPDGATFDALSGYRIETLTDLWGQVGTGRERLDGFASPGRDQVQPVVTFDVFSGARADESTMIGPLAGAMVTGLGGVRLEWWGVGEPLAKTWDDQAITRAVRNTMPDSDRILARGGDGSFAQSEVSRAAFGLLEHVVGGVPVAPEASTAELVDRAGDVLAMVAECFRPTIGFVSLSHFDRGPTGVLQRARARHGEEPLAVVIGPRAVHDLGLREAELADGFGVRAVGRARHPGLLVSFSGPDGLWEQLIRFAYTVGLDRIAQAAGLMEVR